MHSSFLRGSDFRITHRVDEVSHARFFRDLGTTDRVGVFAPGGLDGLGACLLLLAHTTAFYDRYRATGDEFFAYPDHYTFQRRTRPASYGMLDVWPGHKDVPVAAAGETLDAILDRAINVLLVPAGPAGAVEFTPVQMASARRTIRCCYTYSATGSTEQPTLTVACGRAEPARMGRRRDRLRATRRQRGTQPLAPRRRGRLDSGAVVQRGLAGAGARPDPLILGRGAPGPVRLGQSG